MPQYPDSNSVAQKQITALQRWPLAQLLKSKVRKLQSLLQNTARKSSSFEKASVLHHSRVLWRAGVKRKALFIPLSIPADILSIWITNPEPCVSRIGRRGKSLVSWCIFTRLHTIILRNFGFLSFRASCCLFFLCHQSIAWRRYALCKLPRHFRMGSWAFLKRRHLFQASQQWL